jgi:hypothetical protein
MPSDALGDGSNLIELNFPRSKKVFESSFGGGNEVTIAGQRPIAHIPDHNRPKHEGGCCPQGMFSKGPTHADYAN